MIPKVSTVYALLCPIDDVFRYIGMSQNVKGRYQSHLCKNPSTPKEKMDWVLKLRSLGMKPQLIILYESESKFSALLEERWHIKHFEDTVFNKRKGSEKSSPKSFNIKNEVAFQNFKAACKKNKIGMSQCIQGFIREYGEKD